MGSVQAVVLGLVQGLTEFLPISSSAHLRVVAALLGWDDPGAAFTAVTQLGTEAAVVVYFRRDLWAIVTMWTRSLFMPKLRTEPDARMGWYIIVGTLPIASLGFLFQDRIETTFRDLRLVAFTLIVFGLLLGLADYLARNQRSLGELRTSHAAGYGFAQALALIPGVSRSGGTITAGLLMGYRREEATRYSFLLAMPAVFAAGLLELTKIGEGDAPAWRVTLLATVVAFIIGYTVIAWLMRYISTRTFTAFVTYRIVLGLLLLFIIASGAVAVQ